jgi:hypothetical protein
MQQFTGWKGITKDNHIAAIYQRAPQQASNFMVQLLALYRGKSLESELAKYPVKYFDTDDEFTWQVIGSSRRNIPLVEARREDGTVVTSGGANVGVGTSPFYLVFAEDWFADGEVLFGNLNEVYPMRVLGDPRMEGTNAVYKVELMGGITDGIPVERLLQGERFSHEYAPVERELSRKVGDVRFTAPITMRNEWTTLRKQYKLPGSTMLNRKLACGVPVVDKDGNKKVVNMWMAWAEWQFEQEWSDEKNSVLMFGTSNRNLNGEYHNIGKSGEAIRTGSGLLEQMKYGNTYYYNTFSLKLLEDALYELSAAKLDFGERTFIIRTGEIGAILFHNAVRNAMSGWTEFQVNADQLGVVRKTNSPLNKNSLAAGYQFTEFSAPNGVTVKLEVDNFYDDPVRNKVLDSKGHPLMSSRFDIMYIGTTDEPNIFKCALKGKPEYHGYQWGPFGNPFTGQTDNISASYDEDSAVLHKKATLGVCILDPTRTMSLIPAALEG